MLTPEQKAEAKWLKKHGTGAQLHRLIKRFTGEGVVRSCGCAGHVATMNIKGPDWCRENVETIVGWMEEEIERRLKAPEKMRQKFYALEHQQERLMAERGRLTQAGKDITMQTRRIGQIEQQLDVMLKQHRKQKTPGWQLKLAGWKLPGQRMSLKRLILLAVKRAEKAKNRQDLQN